MLQALEVERASCPLGFGVLAKGAVEGSDSETWM